MMKYTTSLLLMIALLVSCRSNKTSKEVEVPDNPSVPALVQFVDSTKASIAIVDDDIDGYFDQVSPADIEIQMKKTYKKAVIEDMRSDYKKYLRTQVSNWTTDEKQAMYELFVEVKKLCDTLGPRIFPGAIKLVKLKTNIYGNDVYFTRGKNIFIPENIFPIQDHDATIRTLLHEVFHILSRYDENFRKDMYSYIGFRKNDKPVILNDLLKNFVLTNPDGVSFQYVIDLVRNGDGFSAVPVMTSKTYGYDASLPSYYDHINFDLFSIRDFGDHYKVVSTAQGQSITPLPSVSESFYEKVKDNTQYIIHPDEIMADNFMMAILAYNRNDYSVFSPGGKELIDKVIARLQKM